jgi:hypothetical protein
MFCFFNLFIFIIYQGNNKIQKNRSKLPLFWFRTEFRLLQDSKMVCYCFIMFQGKKKENLKLKNRKQRDLDDQ